MMNIKNFFKKEKRHNNNIMLNNHFPTNAIFKNVNEEGAQKLSTVFRCVQLISDSVQQLPILPYRVQNNRKEIMYQSPVYKLFNHKINTRMTKFSFVKLLIENMLLHGNAYAYIKRNTTTGEPIELIYIPSDYVLPVYNPIAFDEDIVYQVVGIDGLVEHTDMIHITNKTKQDGVLGISTIHYAALALNIALNSDENANNFFAGQNNTKGFIKVPGQLTTQQKTEYLQNLSDLGTNNNNSLNILTQGAEWQGININPDDAQLLESRQFNTSIIATYFGVPASKLNSKEGVSYNSISAEQIQFLTDTIQPILYKLEDEFETKLLSDFERINTEIKFKIDDILRVDLKTKSEYYRTMFNLGVFSQNEIRYELDMQAIENGDNHFAQVNMMTLDQFAAGENLKTQQNKQNNNYNDADTQQING